MKKLAIFLVCLLTISFVFGCAGSGGSSGGTSNLSGSAQDVLSQVKDKAGAGLTGDSQLPMTLDDPITADNAENMIGLTADQFNQYVTDAYGSTAAIATFAIEFSVIQCKDAASASQVKDLVATGFNSGKWICVNPEQSLVVESGNYVLLAVGHTTQTQAMASAFAELAGNSGSVNIFYEGVAGESPSLLAPVPAVGN